MQRLSYLAALIEYLQTERLITRQQTAEKLGGVEALYRVPVLKKCLVV